MIKKILRAEAYLYATGFYGSLISWYIFLELVTLCLLFAVSDSFT